MKPLSRHHTSKRGSTKSFNRQNSRTNAKNIQSQMRGGWRL